MVYYKSERKELIIPSGFGTLVSGGSSDCSEAIAEAYQSGYTEGYNDGIQSDCGDAIAEAYQSGLTSGKKVFSTKMEFDFDPFPMADSTLFTEPPRNLKVDGGYFGVDNAIWTSYGAEMAGGAGQVEVYDAIFVYFRTQNCRIHKIEFDLPVGSGSVVPSEFTDVKYGSSQSVVVSEQSITFIETTDNTDWYKVSVSFTSIDLAPSYTAGYEDGLAACQNNENQ